MLGREGEEGEQRRSTCRSCLERLSHNLIDLSAEQAAKQVPSGWNRTAFTSLQVRTHVLVCTQAEHRPVHRRTLHGRSMCVCWRVWTRPTVAQFYRLKLWRPGDHPG